MTSARLLVPDELPPRRLPDSVTDAEVAEVAVELSARLLHDVRDLRHERRALRHELAESQQRLAESQAREDPGLRVALARRWPVLRHVLLRGGPSEPSRREVGHDDEGGGRPVALRGMPTSP